MSDPFRLDVHPFEGQALAALLGGSETDSVYLWMESLAKYMQTVHESKYILGTITLDNVFVHGKSNSNVIIFGLTSQSF